MQIAAHDWICRITPISMELERNRSRGVTPTPGDKPDRRSISFHQLPEKMERLLTGRKWRAARNT